MADALHIRARTIPPPKVFISYRWESEAHSAWVAHFVAELKKRGVRVVFDRDVKRANDEAGKRRDRNDDLLEVMMGIASCHVFMPVFTLAYLEGIGYAGGVRQKSFTEGWVFDEFQLSLERAKNGTIETVAVLRAGDVNSLPEPFNADNVLDLRTDDGYDGKLDYLCEYLYLHRVVKTIPDSSAQGS